MSDELYIASQFLIGFGIPMAIGIRELWLLGRYKEAPHGGGEPREITVEGPTGRVPVPQAVNTNLPGRRAA